MTANSDDPGADAELPPKRRRRKRPYDGGKSRLLTLEDLDGRTLAAQRALSLHDRLVSERGGEDAMSALRFEMTRSVAVLSAMVEDLLARWLRGEPIDPTVIATLLNARRREAETVGIDPTPRDVTPHLRDYLAGKQPTRPGSALPAPPSGTSVAADAGTRTSESPNGCAVHATPCNGSGA